MNIQQTNGRSITEGLPNLEDTVRQLIALRVKHGANTQIGHRASNIIELIQTPELPAALIERQMVGLQRLLHAFQLDNAEVRHVT